ncbi:uncharacterized protein LOC18421911 isoform X2 [Amborella trichopoda]|uniref:uncharacterized protein LOC18421911 isoform X2 n=1 Tax=Amborella trichopoda TaxID=13333 RepID=UPI0009BD33F0|nr:uncharacterized protein LOC18421911 isoform X2 [Amborella trichopoda]|eukprot:XP_020518705.1 uncharacterized protein LOC18421911 isoform X2 [Amborella trichopoda]
MVALGGMTLRGNRGRLCIAGFLCWACLMLATPRIPHFPKHHLFADMRNFFGVPNTLNVITNFPFLVVGVLGLVLCLHGNYLCICLRGEVWGWALFYAGIASTAFGSAYYHLKPEDSRVIWDRLPIMIALTSLLSSFIIERIDERIGFTCLLPLLTIDLASILYVQMFDDLRLCMMYHLIPCVAIPAMAFVFPPKYTHSRYWFWAAGFYLLAKFEAAADRKIYSANRYIISGHSLEHLCLVMVPIFLTVMLLSRNIKIGSLTVLGTSLFWRRTYMKCYSIKNLLEALAISPLPPSSQLAALAISPRPYCSQALAWPSSLSCMQPDSPSCSSGSCHLGTTSSHIACGGRFIWTPERTKSQPMQ